MTSTTENALTARFEKTPLPVLEALVAEHFGMRGNATILNSERDETFRLAVPDGPGFVVKLASPQERPEILAFQTGALLHLDGKALALPLPRPLASLSGGPVVHVSVAGEARMLRVLSWLDGVLLHRLAPSLPQMRALGYALGTLHAGLTDYHPAVPAQHLLWDLCQAASLRAYLLFVDPLRRDTVARILDARDALEDGPLRQVRRQVIHNDFNPHNILLSETDPTEVTGVIDFGDMVEAPAVNDLAVALSYQTAAGDGLDAMLAMLQAFHAVQPLEPLDIICLPALLRTRLAMTITITEWRATLYPDNSAYILRNHPLATRGLAKLAGTSDADLATLFQRAIGDGP